MLNKRNWISRESELIDDKEILEQKASSVLYIQDLYIQPHTC
jgi:hypothetical protein